MVYAKLLCIWNTLLRQVNEWKNIQNWVVAATCLHLLKDRLLVFYCRPSTVFYIFSNGMLHKILLLFCSPFCFRFMNISWSIPYIQNPCSATSVLRVRAWLHTWNFQQDVDRKICMWCCGWRFVMKSEGAGSWSQGALCTLSCLSYLPTSYGQP